MNTTESVGRAPSSVREEAPLAKPEERPDHVINTSRVTEEDLQYIDEDDLAFVAPGTGWAVEFADGTVKPLILWGILESGSVHGVVVAADGRIDMSDNVEDAACFVRYAKI